MLKSANASPHPKTNYLEQTHNPQRYATHTALHTAQDKH